MPRTQGIRQQGTLSCLVRKKQKRCIPGSAAFEDISALSLPRAACCSSACAGISCHSPLHTPDCAVTVTLLFHSTAPVPISSRNHSNTSAPACHMHVGLCLLCSLCWPNKCCLVSFLHCRIQKQSELNQATG